MEKENLEALRAASTEEIARVPPNERATALVSGMPTDRAMTVEETWAHVEAINAALHATRRETLEQAAKAAERWGNAPPNPHGRRAALAAAIRGMKP